MVDKETVRELVAERDHWQIQCEMAREELRQSKASYAHLHEAHTRLFNAYYELRKKALEMLRDER